MLKMKKKRKEDKGGAELKCISIYIVRTKMFIPRSKLYIKETLKEGVHSLSTSVK